MDYLHSVGIRRGKMISKLESGGKVIVRVAETTTWSQKEYCSVAPVQQMGVVVDESGVGVQGCRPTQEGGLVAYRWV